MSILTQEILGCLSPATKGASGELLISITFPSEFSGFKGHFPGRPVLPGVCMIETVLVALGVYWGAPVTLRRLVSARWLAPVLPGEKIELAIRLKDGGHGAVQGKVSVTRKGERIAEFSMDVTGAPQGGCGS